MAKHAAPNDRSFLLSVGRHLGAAVGLVAIVAAAFWGIGRVQVDDTAGDPVIENPSEQPDGGDGAMAQDPDDETTDPAPEPTSEPPVTDPAPDPTSEAPASEPAPEPDPTVDTGRIEPSSVSVQILDAVLDDESAAASEIEERMDEDGYRIVASNRASKSYEVTTVFYTAGFEAQAQQVAADYGWSRVEEKPDNLSDSVQVHVVVGADER